jgi:hypothetical protein
MASYSGKRSRRDHMRTVHIIALVAITSALVAAAPYTALRKDFIQVTVTTPSGDSSKVQLTTRGLLHLETRPTVHRRQPWQVIRTLAVPSEMRFAGKGEAFLATMDSTEIVLVVQHVRANPPAPQRLVGRAFRIGRQQYTEPIVVEVMSPRVAQRR